MQQPTKEQIEHLEPLANKISKIRSYIPRATEAVQKLKEDKLKFFGAFQGQLGKYAVEGVICFLVLLFDFWVSSKSLHFLAQLVRIHVGFIAFIFSILDGGVAILASGGFAINVIDQIKFKKMWRPILWGLAVIKIVLFTFLVVNSSIIIDPITNQTVYGIGSKEVITNILPQAGFIILVYAVLHFAGFGLWYVVGNIIYACREFLISKPEHLRTKEGELYKKLNSEIIKIGADSTAVQQYFFEQNRRND